MDQINWQTVVTTLCGVVIPLIIFGATLWAKMGKVETKIEGLEHWLTKVDGAEHACPFVEVRTRNTTNIEQHERRISTVEKRLDVLEHRHEVKNGRGE